VLHITNGDCAIEGLRSAGIAGGYLVWRDTLRDGPIQHIDRFEALDGHAETVLWFEHDLYDQIQLIQLIAWFAQNPRPGMRLSLVQSADYLGTLDSAELAALYPARAAVSEEQLEQGLDAWNAYSATEPTGLPASRPALPFLDAAFRRFAEEFPSTRDGLSRTERQLLRAVAAGHTSRSRAFMESSQAEEAVFLGDLPAFAILDGLASGPAAAMDRTGNGEYRVNAHGRRLLDGHADWIHSRGSVDRWLGGVHLEGPDSAWRWDGRRLVQHPRLFTTGS
jgi:hypothetical protein